GGSLLLAPDVDGAGRVVADQDRGQAGAMPGLGDESLDVARHLRADASRHRLSVDDASGHRGGPYLLVIGAKSAISLRSEPSEAKRTMTIPPASSPVTTPSPNAACTTSSPVRKSAAGASARDAAHEAARPRIPSPTPAKVENVPSRSASSA